MLINGITNIFAKARRLFSASGDSSIEISFTPPIVAANIPTLDDLNTLEKKIGYKFKNIAHLYLALTHSSSTNGESESNERMEFLGDGILDLIISEYLYHRFPEFDEGKLTQIKSGVVSTSGLTNVMQEFEIREFIILGKGIHNKKNIPPRIYANCFESIVSALYLDGGFDSAKKFVLEQLSGKINNVLECPSERNYKSILQHFTQDERGITPTYKVVNESGPDHLKTFEVVAIIGGETYSVATGKTKKMAEQAAAANVLEEIGYDFSQTPLIG